jgi:hypothetical protein
MKKTMIVALLGLAACAAQAADADKSPPPDSVKSPAVLTWLDLQRSGEQASKTPQTLTPVIQERVVKRYLDSFNAPIPVFFMDPNAVTTAAK